MDILFPQSPRVARTKEQKKEEKRQLSKTYAEFSIHVNDVVKALVALFKYSAILYSRKGNSVAVPSEIDGSYYIVGKKELKEMISRVIKEIKRFPQIFRASLHKHRDTKPEDLSGVFSPVYCGEALKRFFSASEGFGPLKPLSDPEGELLMNKLPCVQDGYMLRNSITLLSYDYFRHNNLQGALPNTVEAKETPEAVGNASYIRSDKHMYDSFNNPEVPADFFVRNLDATNPKSKDKVTMAEAVARTMVDTSLTPYQVLSMYKPHKDEKGAIRMTEDRRKENKQGKVTVTRGREEGFQPALFRSYFMQSIIALSFFSKKDIESIVNSFSQDDLNDADSKDQYDYWASVHAKLTNDEFTKALVAEHRTMQETAQEWEALLKSNPKAKGRARA
jgi:hypothetical protein